MGLQYFGYVQRWRVPALSVCIGFKKLEGLQIHILFPPTSIALSLSSPFQSFGRLCADIHAADTHTRAKTTHSTQSRSFVLVRGHIFGAQRSLSPPSLFFPTEIPGPAFLPPRWRRRREKGGKGCIAQTCGINIQFISIRF